MFEQRKKQKPTFGGNPFDSGESSEESVLDQAPDASEELGLIDAALENQKQAEVARELKAKAEAALELKRRQDREAARDREDRCCGCFRC